MILLSAINILWFPRLFHHRRRRARRRCCFVVVVVVAAGPQRALPCGHPSSSATAAGGFFWPGSEEQPRILCSGGRRRGAGVLLAALHSDNHRNRPLFSPSTASEPPPPPRRWLVHNAESVAAGDVLEDEESVISNEELPVLRRWVRHFPEPLYALQQELRSRLLAAAGSTGLPAQAPPPDSKARMKHQDQQE